MECQRAAPHAIIGQRAASPCDRLLEIVPQITNRSRPIGADRVMASETLTKKAPSNQKTAKLCAAEHHRIVALDHPGRPSTFLAVVQVAGEQGSGIDLQPVLKSQLNGTVSRSRQVHWLRRLAAPTIRRAGTRLVAAAGS